MRKILLEGLLVAVTGVVLAFAANALSPRGLQLTRNYFPSDQRRHATLATTTNAPPAVVGTNTLSPAELLSARLREEGLHLANSNQVSQLFHDPRCDQDLIAFIDARDDEHYQAGHIPGAYEFDYYHPDDYVVAVRQACEVAQQIVVYCNGGDCDDSVNAAIMLRGWGVPKEKLLIYDGGMTEWATNRMPIEIGPRKSGNLRNQ